LWQLGGTWALVVLLLRLLLLRLLLPVLGRPRLLELLIFPAHMLPLS
jgi:hypothetical protein